jgi:hypothetical protein
MGPSPIPPPLPVFFTGNILSHADRRRWFGRKILNLAKERS